MTWRAYIQSSKFLYMTSHIHTYMYLCELCDWSSRSHECRLILLLLLLLLLPPPPLLQLLLLLLLLLLLQQ